MKKEKLDILYEDKFLIIVNKKSGILTIANDKEKEKTLYHEVHEYLWRKNKNNKVFIIHRLDKDTSGIVILLKMIKLRKLCKIIGKVFKDITMHYVTEILNVKMEP